MSEADDIDRANELAQMQNDSSIAKVRNAALPEQVQVNGEWPKRECEDCGDEIPAARLALAKIRCIYCQHRLEVRRAGR